jgi:hypothetical protein
VERVPNGCADVVEREPCSARRHGGHRQSRRGQLSLLDSAYSVEEWGLPSPRVLLSGDGHCWIALDYRACGERGEPSVTWFDVDEGKALPLAATSRRSSSG